MPAAHRRHDTIPVEQSRALAAALRVTGPVTGYVDGQDLRLFEPAGGHHVLSGRAARRRLDHATARQFGSPPWTDTKTRFGRWAASPMHRSQDTAGDTPAPPGLR